MCAAHHTPGQMHLKRLKIKDFRNYGDLDLCLDRDNNIFFGNNAQGKSNLVEAIYFLALLNSCRTSKKEEVVRWGTAGFYLMADLERDGIRQRVEVSFSGGKKRLRINSKPRYKFPSLEEGLKAVIFLPDDPRLIMGPPRSRRRFLNLEISQIDGAYRHYLRRYQAALSQRNGLLRRARGRGPNPRDLRPWDEQLVDAGVQIMKKRRSTIGDASRIAGDVHGSLTGNGETLTLSYKPSFKIGDDIKKSFRAALSRAAGREASLGMTVVGPHRDSLDVFINGVNAGIFGSRAQRRTAALSVRLGWVEMISGILGEPPIVLLDDVLSELDAKRRWALLDFIRSRKAQCIVTATDASQIGDRLAGAATFRIHSNGAKGSGAACVKGSEL